ncbi:MAG TPA: GSCFA domain-containing protein [Bacteroidia bacterium]|nr:GSCFA domain-containing protein [Bacteroidia bacterium]
MDFTIKGPKINISEKISIRKPLLVIGSCFAENIGALLHEQLFNVQINPFGIVYNPLSIALQINYIIKNKQFSNHDLFEHEGLFYSWQHHGSFAETDKERAIKNINQQITSAHQQLLQANWLIITLGSAYYYNLKDGQIVSNCHKVAASHFEKKLAERPQIIAAFHEVFEQLNKFNPNINILFNVSPVRYVRDGLTENTLSKSVLHLSINEIITQNHNCFYFPSYEIVIDELRDYRYYKADMLHPNETAIAYIYEKFAEALFDEESKLCIKDIKQYLTFSKHQILNQNNKNQHQAKLAMIKQKLIDDYPFLVNTVY